MKSPLIIVAFLASYAVLLAVLLWAVVAVDGQDARLILMYSVSTALMVVTLIAAVLLLRNKNSEIIAEGLRERDEWEKR